MQWHGSDLWDLNWIGNWYWLHLLYWGVVDTWHEDDMGLTDATLHHFPISTFWVDPTTKPFPTTSSPLTFPLIVRVLEDFIDVQEPLLT